MARAHFDEIRANRSPVDRAIYEATKNIIVWKDAPGAAIPDWPATSKARKVIEDRIRAEFRKQ